MRRVAVAFTGCMALAWSGCFLVGYDGLQPDGGTLPGITRPDAAADTRDSGLEDASTDDDMDASADDAGMDASDDMDASADDASSRDDAGDADADADAEPPDAASEDASAPSHDAGHDAGPVNPGHDAGPAVDPLPKCEGTATCNLECPDIALCSPVCNTAVACDINCNGTDVCNPVCNKSFTNVCEIDCRDTGTCNATCKGAGDCIVDCRNSGSCAKTRCEEVGTQCMLKCSPNDPNCGFEYCWGDSVGILSGLRVAQQTCAGNVVTCGGYAVPAANLPCQPK